MRRAHGLLDPSTGATRVSSRAGQGNVADGVDQSLRLWVTRRAKEEADIESSREKASVSSGRRGKAQCLTEMWNRDAPRKH